MVSATLDIAGEVRLHLGGKATPFVQRGRIARENSSLLHHKSGEHEWQASDTYPGNSQPAYFREGFDARHFDLCHGTGRSSEYLKSMLCEVAWIMAAHRKLYLSGWYWKVKQRKGVKRATIALVRKILSIIYTMLKTGTPYDEKCFEQRKLKCERKRANRLVNELQKLGYVVVALD